MRRLSAICLATGLAAASASSAFSNATAARARVSANEASVQVARQDDVTPTVVTKETEKRRILHLANGQAIRVVARWSEDHWEYRSNEQWKALSSGQVVDTALESDVLKEWNARRGLKDAKTTDGRALLADWAAAVGLTKEGLEELDKVLADEPDHAGALHVLRAHWFMSVPTLQVPADKSATARDQLVRFAVNLPTAGRELAIHELGQDADRSAILTLLAKELRSNINVRRSFAAHAIRRLEPAKFVKPLLMHAVLDPVEEVRTASALGLRAVNEPGVIVPLVRALDSKSMDVRMNAAVALGTAGYAAAVEPLMAHLAGLAAQSSGGDRLPHSNIFIGRQIAYVQDFDVEVAQFQAVADPEINTLIEGVVVDAAVGGLLQVDYVTESLAVRGALENLVNERPGRTNKDWQRWWEANAIKWRSSDLSQPKTGSDK